MMIIRQTYVLMCMCAAFYSSSAEHVTASLELASILPENPKTYDKMRPPKKNGNATIVYFHVTVMSLDSINEGSMTYTADVFFAQMWKDHRLRLPENMTSEYRLLEVEWLKHLWRPDAFFKNAKQVTFQTMTIPNHYVWLYKDKRILYMVKLTLVLSCNMHFANYPHDTQMCRLQIESHIPLTIPVVLLENFGANAKTSILQPSRLGTLALVKQAESSFMSHTTQDLIFDWEPEEPLVVDDNIELPQLDLVSTERADCTQVYSTGNFTCLEVIFTLKRRLGYYLFHTYIPTCLIVIMSWVSFWIKPEVAPARVTLGVTSLLTLSTQHARSQSALPPVSYIKAIDIFMTSCTAFVFLALMEYALVNFVLGDGNEDKKLPELQKQADRVFDMRRGKDVSPLVASVPPPPPPPPPPSCRVHGSSPAQKRRHRAICIDQVSRVLFPLSFIILNGIYWIAFFNAPYQ